MTCNELAVIRFFNVACLEFQAYLHLLYHFSKPFALTYPLPLVFHISEQGGRNDLIQQSKQVQLHLPPMTNVCLLPLMPVVIVFTATP